MTELIKEVVTTTRTLQDELGISPENAALVAAAIQQNRILNEAFFSKKMEPLIAQISNKLGPDSGSIFGKKTILSSIADLIESADEIKTVIEAK